MIILIGSNKGGSGKTTVACNLSVMLAIEGYKICIIDADRQRSVTAWSDEREAMNIRPRISVIQKYGDISQYVEDLNSRFDYIIIDVAGRNSQELISSMMVVDIIICPLQCSQLDMNTLVELKHQIDKILDVNPHLKTYIYQTMASTNPKVLNRERLDFERYVAEFKGFIALDTVGYYRKVYRDVFSEGLSVIEADNPSARAEIMQLYGEVISG